MHGLDSGKWKRLAMEVERIHAILEGWALDEKGVSFTAKCDPGLEIAPMGDIAALGGSRPLLDTSQRSE